MSCNEITQTLLDKMDVAIPRYTSFPTANNWGSISSTSYEPFLRRLAFEKEPLSLYLHIPFCHSMCLYCGCSVVLNRKPENEERYVRALIQEIALVAKKIGPEKQVAQIHFGGGTPTKLTIEQLKRILNALNNHFLIHEKAEIAIEVDPRTVFEDAGKKLEDLRNLGFNRVSLGVQDTSVAVQEAVKRRQSSEMTALTFERARALDFDAINIDLIYGLPLQTKESFKKTAEEIVALSPDRIALFSYAKVPWLKPHQNAIKEETLPSRDEKFAIYMAAKTCFEKAGYAPIGMDHFAKTSDELFHAIAHGTLHRNFQGYTVKRAPKMVSFGMTAVSDMGDGYFQNEKSLETYYQKIAQDEIPTHRGVLLTEADHLQKSIILELMCHFKLDCNAFSEHWGNAFDRLFAKASGRLEEFEKEGCLTFNKGVLTLMPKGQLFVRNIAALFDSYLTKESEDRFSRAI